MNPTKAERFEEFLRRLVAAPPASSFDEAYRLICDVLNAVEDDTTSIPFDPPRWMEDGRLYPPQMDNTRDLPGRAGVKQLRSRRHLTLIGPDGAIEIQDALGRAILAKPGTDGGVI